MYSTYAAHGTKKVAEIDDWCDEDGDPKPSRQKNLVTAKQVRHKTRVDHQNRRQAHEAIHGVGEKITVDQDIFTFVRAQQNRPLAKEIGSKPQKASIFTKNRRKQMRVAQKKNELNGITKYAGSLSIKAPFRWTKLFERSAHTFGADDHEQCKYEVLSFIHRF
jgi:hypothetical protein